MSSKLEKLINENDIVILSPRDVMETLDLIDFHVTTTMLDPWYNRGTGGVNEDYMPWISSILEKTGKHSDNIFLWGFADIICRALGHLPENYELVAWLTWYYKNCPSVIRGWRSAQYTCLHLGKKKVKLYPEHFMNQTQLDKHAAGKMRFIPGPSTVIEEALLIGFVGKKEQVGNPSETTQKPMKVFEPMIKISTKKNDIVVDPMCGTGTTGEVCKNLGRKVILCDMNEERIKMCEERLGVKRVKL
jgi:site-specific DNA-methyltransferase (adenine-specific)